MQVRVEKTAKTSELAGNRRKDKTDWETATERSGTPLVTKKRTVAWSSNGSKLKHEASTGGGLRRKKKETARKKDAEACKTLKQNQERTQTSLDNAQQRRSGLVSKWDSDTAMEDAGGRKGKRKKWRRRRKRRKRRRGKRGRDIGRSLKRLVEWVVVLYLKGSPGTVYRRPSTAQDLGGRCSREVPSWSTQSRCSPPRCGTKGNSCLCLVGAARHNCYSPPCSSTAHELIQFLVQQQHAR